MQGRCYIAVEKSVKPARQAAPGQLCPVIAYSGQTGKNPAVVGSKYQTAALPTAKAAAPAAAKMRSDAELPKNSSCDTSTVEFYN